MENILLIEDEQILSNNLKIILEEEGYKVTQAFNGIEGLKQAHEKKPDLIISDIMMPGIDGYQLLEIISSDETINHIPFIFLTAKAEMENLRAGMRLGADDYLTKPIRAADLLTAIQVRLQKHKVIANNRQKEQVKPSDSNKKAPADSVMLKIKGKIELINKKDIIYAEALGQSSKVYLADKRKIIVGKLLKQWESVLPENQFIRIHRSTLINISYIDKMEPWFQRSLRVHLKDLSKSFIVSKRYAAKLKSRLSL